MAQVGGFGEAQILGTLAPPVPPPPPPTTEDFVLFCSRCTLDQAYVSSNGAPTEALELAAEWTVLWSEIAQGKTHVKLTLYLCGFPSADCDPSATPAADMFTGVAVPGNLCPDAAGVGVQFAATAGEREAQVSGTAEIPVPSGNLLQVQVSSGLDQTDSANVPASFWAIVVRAEPGST